MNLIVRLRDLFVASHPEARSFYDSPQKSCFVPFRLHHHCRRRFSLWTCPHPGHQD